MAEDILPLSAGDRSRSRRAAVAGGVGTLIEYYDFSLYGYLAVVMAPIFFPGGDPVASLLAALAVFAGSYVIRPLGGIFFGHMGDRLGRKRALLAVLVCMGLSSTAMGLLPTPAQAGLLSTVLLVLVRLIQGFSAGGEVGGSATFIAEAAPDHGKAFYGAFTPLGATGGFALAAMVAAVVTNLATPAEMAAWGWRIPFLLAFPLTLFCLWARNRVEEILVEDAGGEMHSPVARVVMHRPGILARATAISAATNGTAYIGLTYMSIHLIQRLGYDPGSVYWVTTVVVALSALAMPVGGLIGDRIGVTRLLAAGLVGYFVLTYPMMALMDLGLGIAGCAFMAIMVNTVALQVGAYTLLPQFFEPALRYTGVALAWNLGVIIAGGTAPLLAVWLIEVTGDVLAPAFFVMALTIVGGIGLFGFRPEPAISRA